MAENSSTSGKRLKQRGDVGILKVVSFFETNILWKPRPRKRFNIYCQKYFSQSVNYISISTIFSLSISLCFSSYFSLSIYPNLTYGCCNHRNLVKCFFNLCEMLPAVKSLTFVHKFVISNFSLEALHKINNKHHVAAITSQ